MQHHTAGRFPEAESIYQQILQTDPNQPDAMHLLGLIASQTGKYDTAVDLIRKAIAIKPDFAEAHINLGNAFMEQEKLDEAAASYHKALAIQPDFIEAHCNLGIALKELGRLDEAIASYHKALAIKPDYVVAHYKLGVAFHDLGELDEAVASYHKALAIQPDFIEAYDNLGSALKELGRLDEAVASYQKALVIKPDYAEGHSNLGNAFKDLGRLDEAVASYQKALAIKPDFAEAHSNLGNALGKQGKPDEAVASYQKALAIKPDYADGHSNLGNMFKELEKLDEALASYRRALEIDPGRQDLRYLISSIIGETTDKAPEKYVRELFDNYARRFDDHLIKILEYKTPTLMRQTVDALPDGPKTFPRALDLGCGTGIVAENFRDMVGEIDGVDLSPKMLEQAEAKGVYANLYLADVLEFLEGPDVRPAGYDLILSADTFVYIGKLDGVFAAARRALTDGGLFVFSVEHLEDGDFKLLPSSRFSHSDAYIEKLAAESGFAVVCHEPVILRVDKKNPIPGRIFMLRAAA